MSLKDDVEARGIKLADLAKEMGEAYGNLYTALQREASGEDIRHKSVLDRLQKIRDWLALDVAGQVRAEELAEGSEAFIAKLTRLWGRQYHPRIRVETEFAGVKTGDVITRREGDTFIRYRILRRCTSPSSTWVDVVSLAKSDKDYAPLIRAFAQESLGLESLDPDLERPIEDTVPL